ncbi:PAS-domain containing protein [Bradyrhizobium australiense]|uniref:PAS-domain containing protein n=1 Tax=Bradyrhizobium australiense TaxID=2721161 RepID=UPI0035E2DE21
MFLDAEGRYILWNNKYAEMYSRSSDLFRPGVRLEDTIRVGVALSDYPEGSGAKKNGSQRGSRSCSNPVPMIVCARGDERILAVNDSAVQHDGYTRGEFEKLTIRNLQAFDVEPPWAGEHAGDGGARGPRVEACQGRRRADRSGDLFAPACLRRPACGPARADGHHRAQARRGPADVHGQA